MNNGYIKLYRKLTECWVWEEPDKLKAWLDLIMMANFKDKQLRNGVVIKRGQVATSEVKLAERWHWSRDRVRRFLRALNDTGMTTTDKTAFGTVVTIVKYGFFQDSDTADDTADNTPDDTANDTADNTAVDTQKNNNIKDLKENSILTDTAKEKHRHGEFKKVLLTDDERDKLVSKYGERKTEEAIRFLDEYITEKGYKSKSHYLAMTRWVFKAVDENEQRSGRQPPKRTGCKYQNFPGRSQEERNEMLEEYRKAGLLA